MTNKYPTRFGNAAQRWFWAGWAVFSLLLVGRAALAQEPLQLGPGPSAQLKYFRIKVARGRIAADSNRPTRSMETTHAGSDRRERLAINLYERAASVAYELTTPAEHIQYEILDGNQVLLRRKPNSGSTVVPLEFNQPAEGRISLVVGEGENSQTYLA